MKRIRDDGSFNLAESNDELMAVRCVSAALFAKPIDFGPTQR